MGTSGPRTQSGWRKWGRDTLVLEQKHRLEAGRCDAEAGKLEGQGWRCGFSPAKRSAPKTKTESSLATSAGTFVAAPKQWELEWVWPARGWQSKELQDQGRLTMAWVPIMGGITVFSVYFHHTEERTERNQQILEAASREIRRCPGLWILAGDFNMEPETFGQYATPARLPGVLVQPAAPTFRHGASVRFFDYFVVHRAVACQIREVRVLEESRVPQCSRRTWSQARETWPKQWQRQVGPTTTPLAQSRTSPKQSAQTLKSNSVPLSCTCG